MPTFTRDNVTLHYELEGTGEPLVYIPGFGSHSNDLLAQNIRGGLGERYQVLTVDNRGSGQTVVGTGAPVNLQVMMEDVAAVMEHLHIQKAHVLGISMGGCIAMLLAVHHPDKVKSLVSAVSFAVSSRPSRAEFMLRTGRAMRIQGVPIPLINRYNAVFMLSEEMFQHTWLLDAWVNAPVDPFQQSNEGFEQQINAMENYDIREGLKALQVPTLVISSPDDLLVPPRFQDEIAHLIPGAEIRRYPGGHVFMLLPMYSPEFLQDVLAFFAKHEAPV